MSSLTDIIFLLLIFFMLTSTIVAPNALNLKLPGTSTSANSSRDRVPTVHVKSNGTYQWNRKAVSTAQLEAELRRLAAKSDRSERSFKISPDKKTPVENVVYVMDMAWGMELNAVLLPEK